MSLSEKLIDLSGNRSWIRLEIIAAVNTFISKVYGKVENRAYGPNEKLPLTQHANQVALVAAMAGCSPEVVVAALLHDAFEGYHHEAPDILEPKIDLKLREIIIDADAQHLLLFGETAFESADEVAEQFSSVVRQLIWAVTEPPKTSTPENYAARKQKYLQNLALGNRLVAEVSIVAKISGLKTALKFFRENSLGWSKGTPMQNVELFRSLAETYVELGVCSDLLNHFKALLSQFEKEGERVWKLHHPEPST